MAPGTSDPARPGAAVSRDTCAHASVAPGGVSAAYLSFPVLSGELEFGSCRDCNSPMLRELGETRWEPIPRHEPTA